MFAADRLNFLFEEVLKLKETNNSLVLYRFIIYQFVKGSITKSGQLKLFLLPELYFVSVNIFSFLYPSCNNRLTNLKFIPVC